jgi:hypothetical protein
MSKKVETIEINAVDNYGDCLDDSMNRQSTGDRIKPKGYVEVYEISDDGKKKKLHGRSNLVLYAGREWLAQRLVNLENTNVNATKDEFISWFGVGDGGVELGDPFTPTPPSIDETDLKSEVGLTQTGSVEYADLRGDDYFYKGKLETIDFETDNLNEDRYLVIKIGFTVKTSDANGKQLSEAGLFTAEDEVSPSTFHLFARVTYPSIVKTSDRQLLYRWYLYV